MSKQRPVPPPPPPGGERPGRRHRSVVGRLLLRIFLLALVVVLVLAGVEIYKDRMFANKDFFGLSHNTDLTDTVVMEKLQSMGQLVTYEFLYENVREIKDSKQIFGLNIPGTTHTIRLKYNGTIKVGYEVSEIKVHVDNGTKTIYVTLPDPKVTDNYIDMDSLSYDENNNIFNPISGDEITGELDTIMAEELKSAESQGIYEKAKGSAMEQITGLFAAFEGYSVKYN